MTASLRLSEDVIDRVFAGRLRALYKSLAKTDFLNFFRFHAVLRYVFNPIVRPDELVDRHSPILGEQIHARNASAERFCRSAAALFSGSAAAAGWAASTSMAYSVNVLFTTCAFLR